MSSPTALPARPAAGGIERGMAMMIGAMLFVPGIDAIAKLLAAELPAGEIAFGRFFFQLLFMLPLAIAWRLPLFRARLGANALRGVLLALATLFFFWALTFLPLAEAVAIFFVEPLLLTLISALLLGEPIGWRRLGAIGVGFVGALIVLRPSFEEVGLAACLPLLAAVSFAFYLTLTRHVAKDTDPVAMQLWAGLFGALCLAAAMAFGALGGIAVLDPVWPSASAWLMLAALGLIATVGHMLIVQAFRLAPAGVLAPFQYLEIIAATILGLLIFQDFPDPVTWIGIAIIIGSGLYVFHRERRLARTPLPPSEPLP